MWHSMLYTFWQSIWHIFWQFFWHIFWHFIWPLRSSGGSPRLRSSGAHWARKVPGCGPAVPTQIGSRQWRPSSAHCARKLAKRLAKSWQGGSGRGSGGRGVEEKEEDEERRRRRTTVIKSNNPHLAGGEQH